MFLHFSLLAGYVVPIAGLIAPIIIWQLKKNELPGLDEHGKVVATNVRHARAIPATRFGAIGRVAQVHLAFV